ncbi:cytochrome P450 [Phanerochaete sordida]|uniref:Cytochrome P450 n=1 Tax=Phanerochaete sordida TaxID=48140 RepID=A0A9P3LLG6_9APHY|nr:cytochrome P450 [Phanerochaete sordida]
MRSEFSTMDAPAGVATPYAFAAALLVLWLLASFFSPQNLRHIPTEGGPSLPILSLIGLYNFLSNGPEVLRRGYERHKGGAFKVALMSRWLVILSGKKLVDELQKLPDDTVTSATMEVFDMQHVFGRPYHTDQMHIPLLRALTRRLGAVFPDMFAEVQAAFGELVPATPDGWTPVHVFPLASTVVARATGRVFVGLPICRDPGYVRLITHFTDDATEALKMLTLAPAFLKGAVARRYTVVDARVREMMGYLRPAVDARMALAAQFGAEWADKPDDLLQGIIDAVVARGQGLHAAPAVRRLPGDRDDLRGASPRRSTDHTLTLPQAVIHALYDLAVRPALADALRAEAHAAVAAHGWTKAGAGAMHRLDSFLRESQRLSGALTVSMFRKLQKPVTLSDGTHLPAGTTLATPTLATHLDAAHYADAARLAPLRFFAPEGKGQPRLETTAPDYLTFGHGRWACPGRFLAANELKAVVAYVLVHYDLRPERAGVRPQNVFRGLVVYPDAHAKVLFRKRMGGGM